MSQPFNVTPSRPDATSRRFVPPCHCGQSLAPGSLSLNLRGLSAENASRFHAAVAELVPKCTRVPVTTESLKEKFKFAPKKVRGKCCSSDFAFEGCVLALSEVVPGAVFVLATNILQGFDACGWWIAIGNRMVRRLSLYWDILPSLSARETEPRVFSTW